MPNPTLSEVHTNQPLTMMSVAYANVDGFVADKVFPNIPVQKQSDLYYKYDMADWNRDQMQIRAPATESAGSGWKISSDTYSIKVWSLHKDVDDQIRANTDNPMDLDRDATKFLTLQGLINKEVQFATNFFATSIWTGSSTGSDILGASSNTTDQDLRWNNTNSTPIEDVARESDAIKLASGYRPNRLVIGAQVWTALKNHPDIVDRIKYGSSNGNPAIVSRAAVAALMELDDILVMDAIKATNAENASFETSLTTSFIGGKNVLLAYVNPSPSIMMPSAGYTYSWAGLLGANALGGRIKTFRRQPEVPADRVEIDLAYVQKVVAARCGAFWSGIVD